MGDTHYCNRCGEEYEWREQEPPEDASVYWVPKCPVCRAKMTDTAVKEQWFSIINDFDKHDLSKEKKEERIQRTHAQARLFHGKVADLSKEELIERAKYFDEKAHHSNFGPRKYRDIAFRLRQQARNM